MTAEAPATGIRIFPERIEMPPLAVAHLRKVTPDDMDMVACYELVPVDDLVYEDRLRDLHVNAPSGRFSPLPGTWLRVLEPDDEENLFMRFGLQKVYGRALSAARVRRKRTAEPLVPGYQIRAMLFGLLGTAGV